MVRLIAAFCLMVVVAFGQRVDIEKQTKVSSGTNGVALVRESSTQVGPADGTDPRVVVEGTGVTSSGYRLRTNSINRWDIRVPSGGTELEFANSTPTAVAEFTQTGNLVWLQNATGPIDRGARVYDVRAFGALCNNAADDTTAFQSAINAAAGVGSVFVPKGTCLIQQTLTVPSFSTIIGEGWNSVVKANWTNVGSFGAMLFVNSDTTGGNTDIRFYNMSIEGLGDGSPTLLVGEEGPLGILFQRVANVEISGIRFYRLINVGASIRGIQRVRFVNNFILECGQGGFHSTFHTGQEQQDMVIANNTIFRVGDDALAVHGTDSFTATARPKRIVIASNTITGWDSTQTDSRAKGVVVTGVEDIAITGNTITETAGSGIQVNDDLAPGTFSSRRVTITGNTVRRAGFHNAAGNPIGINISGVEQATITGNVVTEGEGNGISVNGATGNEVTDILISGNIVADHTAAVTEAAVLIIASNSGTCNRVTFVNNQVRNNDAGGLRLVGCDNTTIEGNVFSNNGNAQGSSTDTFAAGMRIEGAGFSPTIVVRGNRAYDDRGGSSKQTYGLVFESSAGAVAEATVENNILYANQTGTLLINQAPTLLIRRGNRLSNQASSGRAALVNGTVTVNTAEVGAGDNILLTRVVGAGTTRGVLAVGTIVGGTSFVINATDLAASLSADDDSTVYWEIRH